MVSASVEAVVRSALPATSAENAAVRMALQALPLRERGRGGGGMCLLFPAYMLSCCNVSLCV